MWMSGQTSRHLLALPECLRVYMRYRYIFSGVLHISYQRGCKLAVHGLKLAVQYVLFGLNSVLQVFKIYCQLL